MKKQELIQSLTALQTANPDKEIIRSTFRKETGITDSQWETFWGTWTEFKRAAGLEKTPQQAKILAAVSKHSSVDTLKNFNKEKQGWEGRYLKPSSERFQTIVCGSDFHDKLCDPFHRKVFVDTVLRVQPNKVVLAGDVMDLYEFSRYTKDPRKTDIMAAIAWTHAFLEEIRTAAPNAEVIWIEGNHENRLMKLLAEANPHLMPILADLHGFTVPKLLGLDAYEVNYYAQADLATFNETDFKKEIAKNYYIAYDTVLHHHFPYAKNWGLAGINGHHHSHKSEVKYHALTGPYEWHQLGAGHARKAEYCNASKWTNGFMIEHIDTHTKHVQFEYVDTTNEMVCVGGKYYLRTEDETLKL